MFIKVVNWSSHAILSRDTDPLFYLEKDNWDDNYFKTRYHLHLSGNLTDDGNPLWIGELKILKKGQRRDDNFQLEPGKIGFLDYRFDALEFQVIGASRAFSTSLVDLDASLGHGGLH